MIFLQGCIFRWKSTCWLHLSRQGLQLAAGGPLGESVSWRFLEKGSVPGSYMNLHVPQWGYSQHISAEIYSMYIYIYIHKLGVAPQTSNSDQDYYMFSKGFLQTFIWHCYWGPHFNVSDIYIRYTLMIYSRCLHLSNLFNWTSSSRHPGFGCHMVHLLPAEVLNFSPFVDGNRNLL